MRRPEIAKFAVSAALTMLPAAALANGAFPDEFSIYTPLDKPHRILLPTNFGIIITDDDGAHWNWVCEQAIASLPYNYFVGAPPTDTMFAINLDGMYASTDMC